MDEVKLIIEIRRCTTCHATENLVKYSHKIKNGVKKQLYICRPHNRARNTRYYYKNKYKKTK